MEIYTPRKRRVQKANQVKFVSMQNSYSVPWKGDSRHRFNLGKEDASPPPATKTPPTLNQNWIVLISSFKFLSYMMSTCSLAVSLLPFSAHWSAVTPWPATAFPVFILGSAGIQKGLLVCACSAVLGKDSWPGLPWPFLSLWGSSVGSGHPSWYTQGAESRRPMNTNGGNIGHLAVWQAEEDDFSPFAHALHFKCAWNAYSQSSGRSGNSLKIR